jgi:endonuclease/exonuclease/phosphatase family metal-dependent hydrolase
MPTIRIATFNLENLDDQTGATPTLAQRVAVMRPQLDRVRADILCLQEVHGQEQSNQPRQLLALDDLIQGTTYSTFHRVHTLSTNNEAYDKRNLVVLSRFPIKSSEQVKHDRTEEPQYRRMTADPADQSAEDVTWERPILHVTLDLGHNRALHVLNVHMKSKIPTKIPGRTFRRFNKDIFRTVSSWAEGYFISAMKRVGDPAKGI